MFSGEAQILTLQEDIVGDAREPLIILLGTAALVLLVACGNIANLFLARGEARARETAVHLALGSGRGSLVRLVLADIRTLLLEQGAGSTPDPIQAGADRAASDVLNRAESPG